MHTGQGQGNRDREGSLPCFSSLDLGPAAIIIMGQIGKRKEKTNHRDDPGRTVLNDLMPLSFHFFHFKFLKLWKKRDHMLNKPDKVRGGLHDNLAKSGDLK